MDDWDMEMEDATADAGGFSVAPPQSVLPDTMATDVALGTNTNITDKQGSETLAPTKVHIRGLDTLSTDEVRAFVKEHYGPVDRVEWIDDESANLLFSSESIAQEAMQALAEMEITDVAQLPLMELIPARPFAAKPDTHLQVRLAVLSDKKERGAAAKSRYYLFHPEADPEERRRQRERRYRERDTDNRRGRHGRGRRDDSEEIETFDAGMYDDDDESRANRASKPRRHRRSRSRSRSRDRESRQNVGKELFPERPPAAADRRRRDRSASPLRNDDEGAAYEGFEEPIVAGTSSNRRKASDVRDRLSASDRARELFPTKVSGADGGGTHMDAATATSRQMRRGLTLGDDDQRVSGDLFSIKGQADRKGRDSGGFAIKGAASASVTELFPDRFGKNKGKELFDCRAEGRSRPRKKAEDLFL